MFLCYVNTVVYFVTNKRVLNYGGRFMKIKMTSNALIIAFLSVIVIILNIVLILILRSNESFLATISPVIIVIFILSIFNIINLVNVYKDFLTLTDDSIVVNYGLLYKKRIFKLSDIKNVKYNKNNMVFHITNGKIKKISLTFVSKGDEIALYKFLISKSISVVT